MDICEIEVSSSYKYAGAHLTRYIVDSAAETNLLAIARRKCLALLAARSLFKFKYMVQFTQFL
jgi:hypothetical protein